MHFSIIDDDTYITYKRTGDWSFLHFLHDTFLNRRNETLVDHTADDAIVKYQFAAPLQVDDFFIADADTGRFSHAFIIRFDAHIHFPELSGAAALLFVTVICL